MINGSDLFLHSIILKFAFAQRFQVNLSNGKVEYSITTMIDPSKMLD